VRKAKNPVTFRLSFQATRLSGSRYCCVSPTILRIGGYRFFFFSREEPRAHVNVQHETGQAKFWLEPEVELAQNYSLGHHQLSLAFRLIKEHKDEIRAAWQDHFNRRG
jgi:hypothetical protein